MFEEKIVAPLKTTVSIDDLQSTQDQVIHNIQAIEGKMRSTFVKNEQRCRSQIEIGNQEVKVTGKTLSFTKQKRRSICEAIKPKLNSCQIKEQFLNFNTKYTKGDNDEDDISLKFAENQHFQNDNDICTPSSRKSRDSRSNNSHSKSRRSRFSK